MKLYIRKWKNMAKKSAAEGGAHKMRRLSSAASKHAKELEKFATEGEDIKEVGLYSMMLLVRYTFMDFSLIILGSLYTNNQLVMFVIQSLVFHTRTIQF